MRVRLVAAAVDHLAGFGEGGLLVEVVLVAVQVVERAGNHFALRVLPGAAADTVARIDRFRTGGAEVGAPGLGGGAGSGRELLTDRIGAFEPAEIAAIAGTGAGDEEGHRTLLRLRARCRSRGGKHDRGGEGDFHRWFHRYPPFFIQRYIVQGQPAAYPAP